jgi:TRAP-type transport system periplasmic protein
LQSTAWRDSKCRRVAQQLAIEGLIGGVAAMTRPITRRQMLTVSAAAVAATATGSFRSAHAAGPIVLRVSSSAPPDKYGAHYLWFEPFEDNLKKAVGDQIKLEYFPNSQLGKEADVVTQVKAGSVDMMISGPSIWATVVPEIGALDLGFLFDNYAHAFNAIDSGVATVFDKLLLNRAGVTVLGWGFQVGARSVYTKMPIKSAAELKAVKLRVLPTKAFIDTFQQIGAVPTPIPINELYTAAQTGVVDGFEHDPGTVLAYKFYEVCKSCFLTQHYYSPMLAYIGKRGLSKITPELMPKFMQAAADATKQERADVPKVESEAITELKAKGVVFTEVPPAERKAMAEAVANNLYPAFAKQYPVTQQVFEKIAAARG